MGIGLGRWMLGMGGSIEPAILRQYGTAGLTDAMMVECRAKMEEEGGLLHCHGYALLSSLICPVFLWVTEPSHCGLTRSKARVGSILTSWVAFDEP